MSAPTDFASRKQALATSLRLCTIEGLAATPLVMMSLPVNIVLVALFTKTFGLPKTTIGLITALPFACNFLQILVSPFLARWRTAKTVTLVASCFHLVSWLALAALLSFIPREDARLAGWFLAGWFLVSSFCQSLTGVAWSAWIQEWIPARLRGKYFGRRNRLIQISNLAFLLLAGWSLSRWDYALPVFQVLILVAALGAAASMPAWGQLLDRYGNKAVMAFSLLLWQAQNLLWAVLTPDNAYLLYPMWAWGGLTSAGFFLGMFTLLLKLLPVEARNLAIGYNLALTSLVAAIAPILGGLILTRALDTVDHPLPVYHACFLVQPLLAFAAAFLLLRVHEPSAASFTHVAGAMRNIRSLSGVFGLGFLMNYIFYRPRK